MQPVSRSRSKVLAAVFVVAAALAGTSFLISRQLSDGGSAGAQRAPADISNLPGPNETPPPGSTPDTSRPAWHIPYQNAEREKPRFDQEVNGIAVGPTVKDPGTPECEPGEARTPTEQELAEPSAALVPHDFVPTGAIRGLEAASACRDRLIRHRVEFEIPAEPSADAKLANGARWEDVEPGGKITVWKAILDQPAFQSAMYAAERWRPSSIHGLPAAIADPILPNGLGPSAVVVWDAARNLRIVVTGTNRTIDEVVSAAEEMVQ
jgi:hypothetical protein